MSGGSARVGIARTDAVWARLPEPCAHWLSESESARLPTLRVEARRRHYLAGHWLARELLADAFGGTAHDWRLAERRGLAPQVLGGEGRLRVSISHSGEWIAAAVADGPIGIDIEQRPRLLDAALEALLLDGDEAAGRLSQDEMLDRWVLKEAWLKMHGEAALPERLRQLQIRALAADAGLHRHACAEYCFVLATTATRISYAGPPVCVWPGAASPAPAARCDPGR